MELLKKPCHEGIFNCFPGKCALKCLIKNYCQPGRIEPYQRSQNRRWPSTVQKPVLDQHRFGSFNYNLTGSGNPEPRNLGIK